MRFSLIIATLGRVVELKALFESLSSQTGQSFEVIVVDQNADDRLAWVDIAESYSFPIQRKRSSVQHLSHARNVGLRLAVGEIVAFPDDDCVYPGGLLAHVDRAFRNQPDLGVRTGPAASPAGGLGSGRWLKESGEITLDNVWNCVIAFNIFIRRDLANAIHGFDEELGVGGEFGSAEDNDFVLRAIQTGSRGRYEITQLVVHPDKKFVVGRAFAYGAGLGYTLRKHNVPTRTWMNFMIRPVGGCIFNLLRGRWTAATYHWCTLRGRVHGFCGRRHVPKPQTTGFAVEGPG